MLLFLSLSATYIEYIRRHFLTKQKGIAQMIFLLTNNYVLINIGRFRITKMTSNKRQLDYAIEFCLLCLYVCLELVVKNNDAYSKRLFSIKTLRKIQINRIKINEDFRKLTGSTFANLMISFFLLVYFGLVAKSFKLSLIHLALPVR